MPAAALAAAIDAARPGPDLDVVSRGIWAALGAGHITDDEAERLSELIQIKRAARATRKATGGMGAQPLSVPPLTMPRPLAGSAVAAFAEARRETTPDRAVSQARRRLLAASGPLPPKMAAHFTTGELAVLRLVAEEVAARAVCGLTYAELAARAGVGRSTVKRALHQARRLGLVTVEERRRPGRKNLASLVRIVSAEWRAWIGHQLFREGRQPRSSGVQMRTTTDNKILNRGADKRQPAPSTPPRRPSEWPGKRQDSRI